MDNSIVQSLETWVAVLFSLFLYAYLDFSIQTIAKKTGTLNGWMAWIPLLNLVLLCSIIARPAWWIILIFIPLVNLFVMVYIWMEIAELMNRPRWVGFLIIIPPISLFIPGYLAFC